MPVVPLALVERQRHGTGLRLEPAMIRVRRAFTRLLVRRISRARHRIRDSLVAGAIPYTVDNAEPTGDHGVSAGAPPNPGADRRASGACANRLFHRVCGSATVAASTRVEETH